MGNATALGHAAQKSQPERTQECLDACLREIVEDMPKRILLPGGKAGRSEHRVQCPVMAQPPRMGKIWLGPLRKHRPPKNLGRMRRRESVGQAWAFIALTFENPLSYSVSPLPNSKTCGFPILPFRATAPSCHLEHASCPRVDLDGLLRKEPKASCHNNMTAPLQGPSHRQKPCGNCLQEALHSCGLRPRASERPNGEGRI